MVKLDLSMVSMGVIIFLVRMIMLYLVNYLFGHLLSLVLLVGRIVLSNRVIFCLDKVGQKDFHVFVLIMVFILVPREY